MAKKTCAPGKWIPCAIHKPGSLRAMLHMRKGKIIPVADLQKMKRKKIGTSFRYNGYRIPVTELFLERVKLALTLRGFH